MLKAAERQYGVIEGSWFTQCLVDDRQAGKVGIGGLGQRIFGIACGHPDGNDAEARIHKLLPGGTP